MLRKNYFFFVLRKNLVLRASRLSLWQRNRRKWSSLTPAAVILENERALRKGLRTAVVRVYTEKNKTVRRKNNKRKIWILLEEVEPTRWGEENVLQVLKKQRTKPKHSYKNNCKKSALPRMSRIRVLLQRMDWGWVERKVKKGSLIDFIIF